MNNFWHLKLKQILLIVFFMFHINVLKKIKFDNSSILSALLVNKIHFGLLTSQIEQLTFSSCRAAVFVGRYETIGTSHD